MPSLSEEIIKVLSESQNNVHSHQKLLNSLAKLHEKNELELFFEKFFKPFSKVLVVYKREPAALRVIEFVAKFAISTAPRHPDRDDSQSDESDSEDEVATTFFSLLLDKLVSLHEAQWKGVRFRVCQLVSRLLTLAKEVGCVVGTRLLDIVQRAMLERLLDKVPVVRVQAVSALEWLQDLEPDSTGCPVTTLYLSLMATDPSPDVRRCVLNKILMSDRSLPSLIERTRDVKEVIRRDAFLRLADQCSIRHFRIQQRVQLLNDGLNDESALVQEACVNGLLRKWSMESNNGDFITLLARLDVESSSEVAGLALWKLFDNFSMAELVSSMADMMARSFSKPEDWDDPTPTNSPSVTKSQGSSIRDTVGTPATTSPTASSPKVICMTELCCEEAFYWCQLCRYIHNKGGCGQGVEELLEQILPTTSEFCDYIQRYVEEVLMVQDDTDNSLKSQFIVQQLFAMIPALDHSDEVGRRRLAKLVCDLLTNTSFPTPLVTHLLSQHTRIWPQESHRVEVMTEVIADLRQPFNVTTDTTLNATTTFLSQASSQFDPKEDTDTLLRCLTVSCELLRELRPQSLSPTLQMLKDALLIPCVTSEDPYVRDMAVLGLGLLSLLNVGVAREHLLLFVQVSQVDHECVQATALKIVFDLLHIYGFEAFNIISEKGRGSPDEADSDKTSNSSEPREGGVPTAVGGASEGGDPSNAGRAGEGGDPSDACGADESSNPSDSDEAEKSSETMQRLLNIMLHFLEGESSLLSQVAAEGIAKLLLSRRVLSQKLLAKLLILWYNPLMQDEGRLRAVLGAFFPSFAASDRSCRECLGEVYLPVLSSVFEAPSTSPLFEIDAANMADFIIHLTQPSQPDEDCIHDNLAYAVCNGVLSDPTSSDVRVYTRSLSQMTFSATNQVNAAGLLELCEQMSAVVVDKVALRYIDKLRMALRRINPSHEVTKTEETIVEQQEEFCMLSETSENVLTTPINHKKTTKPRAKTTIKKKRQPVTKATKTTAKKSGRGRRKKVVKETVLSSEESESENLEPAVVVPSTRPVRECKSAAAQRLREGKQLFQGSEDSDDSLVGEHSPFVRHTVGRAEQLTRSPLGSLQLDED